MYLLHKMGIFHCHISLPEGTPYIVGIYMYIIYTQFFQIFVISQVWFPQQTFVKFEFTPETRNPSPWPSSIFMAIVVSKTVSLRPWWGSNHRSPGMVQVTGALLFIVMVLPSQYRLSWRDGSREVVFLLFGFFSTNLFWVPQNCRSFWVQKRHWLFKAFSNKTTLKTRCFFANAFRHSSILWGG